MYTIPTTEPTAFAIGETVQWRRAFGDYPPSDGWSLKYYFRGVSALDVTADGTGVDFVVTIKPADTTGKIAGTYQWTAYAEKGAGPTLERRLFASGVVVINPDITAAAAGALQSHEEKMIAAIKARLEGRVTDDMESFTIQGRQITAIPFPELRAALRAYQKKLFRKRNKGAIGQRIVPTFKRNG